MDAVHLLRLEPQSQGCHSWAAALPATPSPAGQFVGLHGASPCSPSPSGLSFHTNEYTTQPHGTPARRTMSPALATNDSKATVSVLYWYGNYPPHRAPLCVRLFGTWPRACAGPDLQAGVREPCTWLNRADPRSVVSRISGPRPRGARHPRGLRHCCVIPERKWGGLRSAHKGCASREGPVIPPRPVSPGSRDEISWCWLQASNL